MTFEEYVDKKKKEEEKQNQSTSKDGKISFGEWVDNQEVKKVNQDYLNSFITDANSFFNTVENDYNSLGWGNASSLYDARRSAWNDLDSRATTVSTWLERNKDNLDGETYKSLYDTIESIKGGVRSSLDAFSKAKDFYAQFDTEEAYKEYEERQKEYDRVRNSADFSGKSQYSSSESNSFWDRLLGNKYDDTYEYINNQNGFRSEYNNKHDTYSMDNMFADDESNLEQRGYDFLKPEEIAIYDYYYRTEGKDRAQEFLDSLENELVQRKANKEFEALEGNTLKEIFYGVVAGADQFKSGIKNLGAFVTGGDGFTSSTQYVSGKIREDLADDGKKILGYSIGQIGYDLVNTTTNMLPSILVGAVTGGALGGATIGATSIKIAQAAGAATLGTSVVGNAYEEMKNLGYDDGQARAYGTLVGASEALLQYFLGGISALGGKVSGHAIGNLVSKVDNAFARTAIKLGGSMLSEGIEESVQTILEPAFKALVTGESFEAPEWEEILYSGLLGALSAGALEGAPTIIGEIGANSNAKRIYGDGSGIVKEALDASAEGSDLRKIAEKYKGKLDKGKKLSGAQINILDEAIQSNDSEIIKKAVLRRLGDLGETTDVTLVAEVLTKYALGEKLSPKDYAILDKSDHGHAVLAGLNKENIASGALADKWSENIGTRRASPEAYNKTLYDLAQEKYAKAEAVFKESVAKTLADGAKAVENKYEASESGETIYNGESVKIKKIASTKDGEVKLLLDNGKTVSAKDVSFASEGEALAYSIISDMGGGIDTANEIVGLFKNVDKASLKNYAVGISLAHKYGTINYEAGLSHVPIPQKVKRIAYNRGRIDAITSAKQQTKTAKKNGKIDKKGGIIFEGGFTYDEKTANELQKTSMRYAEIIDKISSVEIHVFKSFVKDGKRVAYINGKLVAAPNGYFKDGNKIYLDYEAGEKGEGAMVDALAHEIGHYIREKNAQGFKELADFLIAEYGKQGVSVNGLIEFQKDKIKKRYASEGKPLPNDAKLFDMAYEEVVADAMSEMLADPNAIDKLIALKQKNRGLWAQIGEAIKHLLDKLKAALGVYKNTDRSLPQEAMLVRDFSSEAYNKLQDLYLKAFVEADANYESADADLADSGIIVDSKTESASLYSVRDLLDNKEQQKVSETLATRFGVTVQEAKDWISAETSLASIILNPKYSQYLDYVGDASEEAIKSNSDYPQGTVDFSNICKKRRDFTEVMNRVLRNFPNHVFAATDLAKIRTIMSEEGMEVACGICYVEDRRQLDSVVAQDFIDSLDLYRKGSKTRPDGKSFNANQLKALKLIDGDSYTPSIYELISLEGRNSLKAKNPSMEEAWVKFNNARGMQSVRLLLNDAEYKRQILKYSPSVVERKNNLGGLRIYSFSDMEMFHLIDIIQVITDSATVGLSLQGYTKVNEYARAVKDTGEKLNRSLIPKGDLGYHMEKGEVVLDFDTVEGIDINHPDFFDNIDNPNIGNIVIGINDVQIRAAMRSEFIDQIIPFHTGQSGEVLGEKGIASWQNYKDFQSERDVETGKKSSHQINIYTEVIQAAEKEGHPITHKREFVEKFLQVCKENGLTPRFSQFLNIDDNGDYAYTEGYHKFLVDFKTFDQRTGEYLPQMPVKPVFENTYLTKLLKGHVKTQKAKNAELAETMPKVLDRITKEIVGSEEVKFSDRDSEGRVLSAEQQEFFKDSKVRDSEGNLTPVYHGTPSGGFTEFKLPVYLKTLTSAQGAGFYFTDKANARQYMRGLNGKSVSKKQLYKVYLNITNPLEISEYSKGAISDEVFRKIMARGNYEWGMAHTDIEKILRYATLDSDRLAEMVRVFNGEEILTVMKEELGYDGVRFTDKYGDIWVAWDKSQIKNTTNKAPTSDPDIRYSDRNPREVTEQDVRDVLENIGKYDQRSYFPVRINTPKALIDAAKKRGDVIEDLPVVMQVKKAQQAMSDDVQRSSIERAHGLSTEDMISILKAMDDPTYIVYQENGRYAEVVRFETESKKRAIAILEIGENKNAIHMNGYDGGIYQVLVTAFVPDSYQYIKDILDNKKNTVLPIEKKKGSSQRSSGSQVPSLLNDSPFFKAIIPQDYDSVKSKFSDRDPNSVSNRSLLANALESAAQNDIERNKLAQYKSKIALIESEQAKFSEIKAKANELRFTKGRTPGETKQMRDLEFEANQIANRISTYDKQLLNLESTAALKGVLEREKTMLRKRIEQKGKEALRAHREKEAQKTRVLMNRYQESRKKAIDSRHRTEMRHRIKNVVTELDKLLRKGSKERNVKLGLQSAVASALEAVNMDTVAADERIAKLKQELVNAKTPEKMQEISRKIDHIQNQGDRMASKLEELRRAYADIKASEENVPDYYKAEASLIADKVDSVMREVGDTPLRNMTMSQLEAVYNLYTMVLTTVRNANAVFRDGKLEDLQQNASNVMTELESVKKLKEERSAVGESVRGFSWNEMIPAYAFDRIGSATLTKFFWECIKGQNTFAVDISEANDFASEAREKYGYKKWDVDKIHEFTLADGRTFRVSLKHMMSIYAYSKRDQAIAHMQKGGFFFNDKKTFRKVKGVLSLIKSNEEGYCIDESILGAIKSAMTSEQIQYVDAMQDYLTKMGEKGNEVSRVLWGIDIFKEKIYFPLKSSHDFIFQANQTAQEASLKNDGMTKETVPNASNPIVLEEFDDVWASHVNRMSQYHAFVLPIENLNKIHNYGTWNGTASMSVSTMLTARYGNAVNEYLTQFIRDLNGVSTGQGASNPFFGFVSKFKKTAVAASLSVVVQQPTAILRALAVMDAKYFVGKPNTSKLSAKWEEMKKYAPITIIKEIGGFDAGAGRQATEWMNSDIRTGVDKVLGTIDDVSMYGAAFGDMLGWSTIWEAVKREVKATTNLDGDALLQKAGERFTEVIVKTQVYDSTLSRSGYMRSKHDSVKMLTSFMGEPTVSFNMLYNAVTQAVKGKISKRGAARTIGAVYASVVSASVMASLIYALRDDDDDESYLEKFAEAFGGKLIGDINPLNMLPAVRDIISILDGWDVSRTDMDIFQDIYDAVTSLDSDNKSAWRKVEDLAGAFASLFGVPLKNTLRTGREIYNAVKNIFDDIKPSGVGDAFGRGITGEKKDKGEALYNAIINRDEARLDIYRKGYKDDKAYETAVRSALRENDPRIREAAEARNSGDTATYMKIVRGIVSEGHFSQDTVVSAVNAEINALNKGESDSNGSNDKVESIFVIDDYFASIVGRDEATAYSVKEDLIRTAVANGKDREEAESKFYSDLTSHIGERYEDGEISKSNAEDMLVRYGNKTAEEASSKVQYWDFKKNYPDYDLNESAVSKYYEYAEPSGIGVDVYYDYSNKRAKCKGTDSNGYGKTDSGSVKSEVLKVINSLPITSRQKDALYYLNGWSASTLYEAPWH